MHSGETLNKRIQADKIEKKIVNVFYNENMLLDF
jgi:hypothetical protein